jgi:hypothetical protein
MDHEFRFETLYVLTLLTQYVNSTCFEEPGNSVSIVSGYELDDRGSISSRDIGFSSSPCVQIGSGFHQTPIQWVLGGLFPGGKTRPGRDFDDSPPSGAEVKNDKELYLLSPQASPLRVAGKLYLTLALICVCVRVSACMFNTN